MLPGGKDITTDEVILATYYRITSRFLTSTGIIHITPITTMVYNLIKNNVDFMGLTIDEKVTKISQAKSKISTAFDIPVNNISDNFIATENTSLAKTAIQLNTTINILTTAINSEDITHDDILISIINGIEASDDNVVFNLADNDTISDIITNTTDENNIVVDNNIKQNIATYTTMVNYNINEIETTQSINKLLTATTKIAVASTKLLIDELFLFHLYCN